MPDLPSRHSGPRAGRSCAEPESIPPQGPFANRPDLCEATWLILQQIQDGRTGNRLIRDGTEDHLSLVTPAPCPSPPLSLYNPRMLPYSPFTRLPTLTTLPRPRSQNQPRQINFSSRYQSYRHDFLIDSIKTHADTCNSMPSPPLHVTLQPTPNPSPRP